jgi:short-subunit dehydrogenase
MGAEFARQLAARPGIAGLWLLARREDRLAALATELSTVTAPGTAATAELSAAPTAPDAAPAHPTIRVVPGDLSGRAGGERLARLLAETAAAHEDEGGIVIDTLVNNAGFGTYGPFGDTDLDRQLEMIDLNVTSVTAICGAALPYLAAGSRVVNTASLAAFAPLGGFAVYAATKAYVLYFSLGWAAEIEGRGVQVMALCPGSVDTEFSAVASNGLREKVPKGKDPAKVAAHCLRLLDRGKNIAVMAPIWKLKAFASHLVGKMFAARVTMRTEKRPSMPRTPPTPPSTPPVPPPTPPTPPTPPATPPLSQGSAE